MRAENFDVAYLKKMMHSPIRNYAVPGLTSWLIGECGPSGAVRMFSCERDQQEAITPHSHRFDLQCWVLDGEVRNRIWSRQSSWCTDADTYEATPLVYGGKPGEYVRGAPVRSKWSCRDSEYLEGDCYSMKAEEVHSIYFSRGALVLFFEGPTKTDTSIILEPVCNNEVVSTFKVEPWMFQRTQQCS